MYLYLHLHLRLSPIFPAFLAISCPSSFFSRSVNPRITIFPNVSTGSTLSFPSFLSTYPAFRRREVMYVLDPDQHNALAAFKAGKNLAIFGGGGCGKSVLLSCMISTAKERYVAFPAVASCALTTHAAERIGGRTIHSLFGAPPFWPFNPLLWEMIKGKTHLLGMLSSIKVLLIDEVTLLSDRVLDTLDIIMRNTASRGMESVPFGGRQIILAGDPFQLDAIIDNSTSQKIPLSSSNELVRLTIDRLNQRKPGPMQSSFAWFLTFSGLGDGVVVFLSRNHRQHSDGFFFDILSRIRLGLQSESDINILNACGAASDFPPLTHTQLCLRRRHVNKINADRLMEMPGVLYVSQAEDIISIPTTKETGLQIRRRLDSTAMSKINLKIGMQVLLSSRWNGLTPGSRGKIIDITQNSSHDRVDRLFLSFDCRRPIWMERMQFKVLSYDATTIGTRSQFPILPAYAITVHRSQGMTIKNVSIEFYQTETWIPPGMVYVVLSRSPTISGLWIRGLTNRFIRQSASSFELMKNIEKCAIYSLKEFWGIMQLWI